MPGSSAEIVACPPEFVESALDIALRNLDRQQRSELTSHFRLGPAEDRALFVVLRDGAVQDAAWGQLQPGNTAVLWPPQFANSEAELLVKAVVQILDGADVCMTQVLLAQGDNEISAVLKASGFAQLAELLYLSWETKSNGDAAAAELEFERFHELQQARLAKLLERTYEGTQDCPELNGRRPIEEVIAGYRATGVFRPENWQFVRAGGDDVGVLLLAEHPDANFMELVYMGLRPEHRGRGWGRQIARQAQEVARVAGVERLLVAVDAANLPALATYNDMGFRVWDGRTVFVRFCATAG